MAPVFNALGVISAYYGQFLPPRETSRVGASALQDPNLLTKQQDLEIFLTLRPSEQSKEIQEYEKELYKHSHNLSPSANVNDEKHLIVSY